MDLVPDDDGEADAARDHREDDQPEAKRSQAPVECPLLAGAAARSLLPVGARDGGRVEELLLDLFPLGQSHGGSLKFLQDRGWQEPGSRAEPPSSTTRSPRSSTVPRRSPTRMSSWCAWRTS